MSKKTTSQHHPSTAYLARNGQEDRKVHSKETRRHKSKNGNRKSQSRREEA
jgi:hypothetical protein